MEINAHYSTISRYENEIEKLINENEELKERGQLLEHKKGYVH